jgi:hypothetical protein
VVILSGGESTELPVGRAGGRASVCVDVVVGSSDSVISSVVSGADSVTVTVVAAVIVPILVTPGAVSVTVLSIVVVYVEPPAPPATTTVFVSSLVVELGSFVVRPDVAVAVGKLVVVVRVLTHTHPTS